MLHYLFALQVNVDDKMGKAKSKYVLLVFLICICLFKSFYT